MVSLESPFVQVASDRLGTLEVDVETVIALPSGLPGFPDASGLVLVGADEVGAYCWLQSVDEPGLSFLAVAPGFFFDDYVPELPDDEAAALDLQSAADVQLLCLVAIAGDAITANLMAPVVLNVRTRSARQVVLHDQRWGIRVPLGAA